MRWYGDRLCRKYLGIFQVGFHHVPRRNQGVFHCGQQVRTEQPLRAGILEPVSGDAPMGICRFPNRISGMHPMSVLRCPCVFPTPVILVAVDPLPRSSGPILMHAFGEGSDDCVPKFFLNLPTRISIEDCLRTGVSFHQECQPVRNLCDGSVNTVLPDSGGNHILTATKKRREIKSFVTPPEETAACRPFANPLAVYEEDEAVVRAYVNDEVRGCSRQLDDLAEMEYTGLAQWGARMRDPFRGPFPSGRRFPGGLTHTSFCRGKRN